jgi:hypothetical protein
MTSENKQRVLTEEDLVSTYDPGIYDDPIEAVKQYRKVREYHEQNPDDGSTLVSRVFDLPRGRVHGWLEDGRPDQVKAIEFGEQYGWFDGTWEDAIGIAFNVLVAAIFSGGSIGKRDLVPRFTFGKGFENEISTALEHVAGGYSIAQDVEGRETYEVVPKDGQAPVARALIALGAPIGPKNSDAEMSLPSYLYQAPKDIKRSFLRIYIGLRYVNPPDSDYLIVREDRPEKFLDELTEFLNQQVSGEVYRKSSIVIPYDVASELNIEVDYN